MEESAGVQVGEGEVPVVVGGVRVRLLGLEVMGDGRIVVVVVVRGVAGGIVVVVVVGGVAGGIVGSGEVEVDVGGVVGVGVVEEASAALSGGRGGRWVGVVEEGG